MPTFVSTRWLPTYECVHFVIMNFDRFMGFITEPAINIGQYKVFFVRLEVKVIVHHWVEFLGPLNVINTKSQEPKKGHCHMS